LGSKGFLAPEAASDQSLAKFGYRILAGGLRLKRQDAWSIETAIVKVLVRNGMQKRYYNLSRLRQGQKIEDAA
jgi:hypothetical protein